MDILDTLSDRFKIYTYRDRHDIPEIPGTYAWFFPLYMFDNYETAQELADFYRKVFALDSFFAGGSELTEKEYTSDRHTRSWQSVSIKTEVTISPGGQLPEECQQLWESVRSNPKKQEAFKNSLMAASLLMPPLYIGKSNNLNQRYNEHIKKSTFNSRFRAFCDAQKIRLDVHNLLFCCVSLDSESERLMMNDNDGDSDHVDKKDSNVLLEHILMKSARPPFSKQ
jgi:hypothetical protein